MNMDRIFDRTKLILGEDSISKLQNAKIILFGLGGVGGAALESLVRMGVGNIDIVDSDIFSATNLNRQILSTADSIGKKKVDVAEYRARSINPDVTINKYDCFYLPDDKRDIVLSNYDYVIDAIDTISAKLSLIEECHQKNIPIISCLGCGNRLDPTKLEITDIHKTENDPLAKIIRKECRNRGIKKLKVVYSKELPLKPLQNHDELLEKKGKSKGSAPGSCVFVPNVAGVYLAYSVVSDLINK